ncbi:hypothetical protein RJ641_027155 [Dillenia turbinata]|uniref:Uncharacterized protein n=1 Tax=Dillenia turbinata TaxID=194707 RepID=A0AAN8ZPE0_9MAGN
MEHEAAGVSRAFYFSDEGKNGGRNEVAEHNVAATSLMEAERETDGAAIEDIDNSGDVNMEAYIMPDDVLRAGGFGGKDDIGSFLPAAIDSTDFETYQRDAQDYEEPLGEISGPGLGWTEGESE